MWDTLFRYVGAFGHLVPLDDGRYDLWNAIVELVVNMINVVYGWTVAAGLPSYGAAIIILTAIIRILMFPLNMLQAKNSRAMALLQPRLQRLQQHYKNSPEILNRETQTLYRRYKVNPFAGCLPLLAQMPVLFALFSAMRDFPFTGPGAEFFWIPSLAEPDPTQIVMPVIVGFSSYLQSKLSMEAQPPANEQMKSMNTMMLYIMPVMMGWMTRNFPAGLAIYWAVFNILGFVMQIPINAISKQTQESMKEAIEADEARAVREAKAEETQRKKDAEKKREADRQRARQRAQQNKGAKQGDTDTSVNVDNDRGKPLNFDD